MWWVGYLLSVLDLSLLCLVDDDRCDFFAIGLQAGVSGWCGTCVRQEQNIDLMITYDECFIGLFRISNGN
jgi:hypothetical protein